MRSPFDDLGKPRVAEPKGEEITGAFSCQQPGCYGTSHEARYISEIQTVTWLCPVCNEVCKVKMNLD